MENHAGRPACLLETWMSWGNVYLKYGQEHRMGVIGQAIDKRKSIAYVKPKSGH